MRRRLSLLLNLRRGLAGLGEAEFGGFGGDGAHLVDDVAHAAVVVDPVLVERGFGGGEASGGGFAVDLAGELPVGAVGFGWVGAAFAAR